MTGRRKLPVSGSEPVFTFRPYGTTSGIVSANCYAYAMQHALKSNFKLQPGDLSQSPSDQRENTNLSTCHPVQRLVLDDLVKKKTGCASSATKRCPAGFSKICLLLSKNNDFHFLRQNGDVIYKVEPDETRATIARKFRVPMKKVVMYPKTGISMAPGKCVRVISANVWSHKRGLAFGPDLYDAKGHLIFDPREANFDYGDLNYNKVCSFFCVRQKMCTLANRK